MFAKKQTSSASIQCHVVTVFQSYVLSLQLFRMYTASQFPHFISPLNRHLYADFAVICFFSVRLLYSATN